MQPGCPPRPAPRMETAPSTYRASREPSPPGKCTCSGPNRPIDSLPLEQERLTMPSSLFRKAAFAALGLASCVTVASAQAPSEINFGVISTEASVNQKKNWEPFVDAISKSDRFQGQSVLRQRLRWRDRSDALQQGSDRLVRQQIGNGGGRPCEWRGLRSDRRKGPQHRLLFAYHRQQGQPVQQARRHSQM